MLLSNFGAALARHDFLPILPTNATRGGRSCPLLALPLRVLIRRTPANCTGLLGAAPDARRRRMTHAEIAARLGVSARTIDRYMVKT
jgi:hypothetical protein